MTTLKHKNVPVFGVKTLSDDGEGIVEAFVSGIGNKDSAGDIVMPGAYEESLAKRNPKGVWAHQWEVPVSKTLEIYEVPAGDERLPAKIKDAGIGALYVKTQFNLKTQRGRDAYEDVQFFGDEGEWSIGYAEIETQFSKDLQANLLLKVDLYEYSFVLFGANNLTATSSLKALVKDVRETLADAKMNEADALSLVGDLEELDAIAAMLGEDEKIHRLDGDNEPDPVVAPDDEPELFIPAEDAPIQEKGVQGSYEDRLDRIFEAVRALSGDDPEYRTYAAATFEGIVIVRHIVSTLARDDSGAVVLDEYGDPLVASREEYFEQHSYTTSSTGQIVVESVGIPVDLVEVVVGKGLGELFTDVVDYVTSNFDPTEDGARSAKELFGQKAGSVVLSKANLERVSAAKSAIDAILDDYAAKHGQPSEEKAVEVDTEPVDAAVTEPVDAPEPVGGVKAMPSIDPAVLAEFQTFAKGLQ